MTMGAAAFVAGASVYLVLAGRMGSLGGAIDLALGGESRGLMFAFSPAQVLQRFAVFLGYQAYQFPLIAGVVGLGGWLWALARRRDWWALTTAIWAVTVLHALNFDSSDVYVFYVPAHVMFAIWVGFGFRALYRAAGERRLSWASLVMVAAVALTPLFYWETYRALETRTAIVTSRDKGNRYYLFPPKQDAGWFANRIRHLLRTAAPGGAVLLDWNDVFTARYFQEIEEWRRDLRIVDVTPAGPGDPRARRAVEALRAEGVTDFHFADETLAREAAGSEPVSLHTVGWRIGGEGAAAAVRDGRARLAASRREVPLLAEQAFAAAPQRLLIETTRIARGEAVWLAVENAGSLAASTGTARTVVRLAIALRRVGPGGPGRSHRFSPRRPLHGAGGRFDFAPFEFETGEAGATPATPAGGSAQPFFVGGDFYCYLITPVEAPKGAYEVLLEASAAGMPRRTYRASAALEIR